MDKGTFLELLKANQWDAVTAAIKHQPALVVEVWDPQWDIAWEFNQIPQQTWVRLFRQCGYTVNGEPAPLPDEPILLYRGANAEQRHGMAWTANYDLAYAYRLEDGAGHERSGDIYAHWAVPDEMLAHQRREGWKRCQPGHAAEKVTTSGRYSWSTYDEYVLDPAYLSDDNVTCYQIGPGNYAAAWTRGVMFGSGWPRCYVKTPLPEAVP